ncbi:MAG: CBU_0592 family membrane protein [Candidatus Microsaccharimonas sp.]
MKKTAKTKKPIKHLIAEIAGWYGALAILTGYALVSFNLVDSGGLAFQLLNLTGATGIFIISVVKHVGQSIVLNVFWAAVAIIAIFNIFI